MAAPAFGSAGAPYAPGGAGGTSHPVPVPAGVAAGDVVLVHFYVEATAAFTPPSGFTEIPTAPFTTGTVSGQRAFWKRATGADSGTYTFTTGSTVYREAVAIRYTGCIATGAPYDTGAGAPASAQRSSSGTSTPAVSLTTQGADRLLVWAGGSVGAGAWTPPSGFTERYDNTTELSVATAAQATAGSTGSVTGTGPSGYETAFLIALLPDAITYAKTGGGVTAAAGSGPKTVVRTFPKTGGGVVGVAGSGPKTVVRTFSKTGGGVIRPAGSGPTSLRVKSGGAALRSAGSGTRVPVAGIPPSTLLASLPGPLYEVLVVARVPDVAGPPTLLIVDDIRWTAIAWETSLSKPQALEVACTISTLTEPVLQRLRSPAALATELWCLRDGQIVAAGPVTSARRDGEKLTLSAAGLLAYLGRMIVEADTVFSQVDQSLIVKAMVDAWQGRTGGYGNFGVDTSVVSASGVLRDGTYLRKDMHNVLQRVQEMGQRAGGFDIDVDPASRALQVWAPQRGVDRSTGEDAIVFDARNITTASAMFSVGPRDVATVAFGTGTNTDSATGTLYSTASNAELLAQYGASGVTDTWDSVSEQGTLDAHVQALVDARAGALFVPGGDVRVTPDADRNAYDAGDIVDYKLDDQLGLFGAFRLQSLRTVVGPDGSESVTPTFV